MLLKQALASIAATLLLSSFAHAADTYNLHGSCNAARPFKSWRNWNGEGSVFWQEEAAFAAMENSRIRRLIHLKSDGEVGRSTGPFLAPARNEEIQLGARRLRYRRVAKRPDCSSFTVTWYSHSCRPE